MREVATSQWCLREPAADSRAEGVLISASEEVAAAEASSAAALALLERKGNVAEAEAAARRVGAAFVPGTAGGPPRGAAPVRRG